jgi:hypothetical protein
MIDSEKEEISPIEPLEDTTPIEPPQDPEKGQPPVTRSTTISDWNGPDDPDNPLNWPKWKRQYHVVPAALISFSA